MITTSFIETFTIVNIYKTQFCNIVSFYPTVFNI
jgi:hypothetical protein